MAVTRSLLYYAIEAFKPITFIVTYIALFIVIILVPILFTPLVIYRLCVKMYYKLFRPDLEILASGNSVMFMTDQAYGRNTNTTVIALKVVGNLEIEHVRKITTEKLLNVKTSKGTLKYPELQQYPVKWMGYYFWKQTPKFDINYHVDYYEPPEDGQFYTDAEAALVESKLVTKSHKKENSPWQIIILPNVKSNPEDSPHSIFFFRTHHGLMDGFALCQIIIGDLGGLDLSKRGFIPAKSNCISKVKAFFYYFVFLFTYPFDALYVVDKSLHLTKENDFRLGHEELSTEQMGAKALKIPLNYIKEIRQSHNVDFGSVIIAAWIGGLRRTMLSLNMKIPHSMAYAFPLATPGHPGLLRVHASAVHLSLPIGIDDPVKRLKSINQQVKRIKGSTNTKIIQVMQPFLGSIPPFMVEGNGAKLPGTGVMNIFLGTTEPVSLFGHPVTEIFFSYGQQFCRQSILFSSTTYCDDVFVKTAVNTNIFSQQSEIDTMNGFVLEELDFLSKHGAV